MHTAFKTIRKIIDVLAYKHSQLICNIFYPAQLNRTILWRSIFLVNGIVLYDDETTIAQFNPSISV